MTTPRLPRREYFTALRKTDERAKIAKVVYGFALVNKRGELYHTQEDEACIYPTREIASVARKAIKTSRIAKVIITEVSK